MTMDATTLDTRTCDELLRLLADLSATADQLNAAVGTPAQADAQHQTAAHELIAIRDRMDRITDLLLAKGCAGADQP